jgi:hypothetical protein
MNGTGDGIQSADTGGQEADEDARDAAIRTVFMALGLTPLMLVPTTTGSIGAISTETAVPAGLVGAVVGVLAFLVVDRLDVRHVNDAVALVVMLALVVVVTAVVWLVVPPGATPTFVVGCIAFLWGMALSGVSRHVVWPRFIAETG